MPTLPTLPSKLSVYTAILKISRHVAVHLDPRRLDVLVPARYASSPAMQLNVGPNFSNPPIGALTVDESGIYGIFTFDREPYQVSVPWAAVFAMTAEDGRGMIFPDDAPTEVSLGATPVVEEQDTRELGSNVVSLAEWKQRKARAQQSR